MKLKALIFALMAILCLSTAYADWESIPRTKHPTWFDTDSMHIIDDLIYVMFLVKPSGGVDTISNGKKWDLYIQITAISCPDEHYFAAKGEYYFKNTLIYSFDNTQEPKFTIRKADKSNDSGQRIGYICKVVAPTLKVLKIPGREETEAPFTCSGVSMARGLNLHFNSELLRKSHLRRETSFFIGFFTNSHTLPPSKQTTILSTDTDTQKKFKNISKRKTPHKKASRKKSRQSW